MVRKTYTDLYFLHTVFGVWQRERLKNEKESVCLAAITDEPQSLMSPSLMRFFFFVLFFFFLTF